LGVNRVGSQPIAPRLRSLDGVKLGILNNSKPNSLKLQQFVVELIGQRHIHIVVTGGPGKHSAFIPTFGTSKSVTRKIETPR
jgi:hypothetical protein